MANPNKVLGFLDIAGKWDPSLIFVMLGAIVIGFIGFKIAKLCKISALGDTIDLPTKNQIDYKLIIGSAIFGIGWGLAGVCPGPALVALGGGISQALIFVVAMSIGMYLARIFATYIKS